ncbi:hypothetical protein MRX96_020888 [Rhipicephalus microplus]
MVKIWRSELGRQVRLFNDILWCLFYTSFPTWMVTRKLKDYRNVVSTAIESTWSLRIATAWPSTETFRAPSSGLRPAAGPPIEPESASVLRLMRAHPALLTVLLFAGLRGVLYPYDDEPGAAVEKSGRKGARELVGEREAVHEPCHGMHRPLTRRRRLNNEPMADVEQKTKREDNIVRTEAWQQQMQPATTTSMETNNTEVKNSTLITDEAAFGTNELKLTTPQGIFEDSISPTCLTCMDAIENRTTPNENANGTTELAMLNTTLQMMVRLLERQLGTPPGRSNDNATRAQRKQLRHQILRERCRPIRELNQTTSLNGRLP